MLELTKAYGVFPSQGNRLDPYMIIKVEDSRGQTLYERNLDNTPIPIFSAALAKEMNAMLARVVEAGTGGKAKVPGWRVAGKTGTSQGWRDAWFIGFTSQMIGGVWVGNDDDSPMQKVSGGGLPADIWSDVMTLALADIEPTKLPGAEELIIPSKAAEERITFYRSLAGAFGQVAERAVTPASIATPSQ